MAPSRSVERARSADPAPAPAPVLAGPAVLVRQARFGAAVANLVGVCVAFVRRQMHAIRYRPPKARKARVVVIVPAHNEEDVIGACVESLLRQTRRPDRIVVAADNCSDRTAEVARNYRGVIVHVTVDNQDRKVGALTQAWAGYAKGYDFVVGVDADTVLAPDCLYQLEAEMVRNPGIGGLMARYTFNQSLATKFLARWLLRLQRFEFTGWTVDILRRRRKTYVLGGQATMFRGDALADVAATKRRLGPWDPNAQVEDMELTWALNNQGWETKVSATARAYVGPMLTLKSFWAQRRKWDEGMIRLLLESGVNRTTAYPWRMQAKMALDAIVRVLFVLLTTVSLVSGNYRWYWIWAIPPALAVLLNIRTLRRMPDRTLADTVAALTLLPVEAYLWFRLFVWLTSWGTVLAGIRKDGWARQYKAEGKTLARAA
jgi:poly-beta-1,6-N-acetyl-D-glucosamine synthase